MTTEVGVWALPGIMTYSPLYSTPVLSWLMAGSRTSAAGAAAELGVKMLRMRPILHAQPCWLLAVVKASFGQACVKQFLFKQAAACCVAHPSASKAALAPGTDDGME